MRTPRPEKINVKGGSRVLELAYDHEVYALSFEFLRVHSPSAEVQGHGQPVLQTGKRDVQITKVEPVGNYGLKLTFSDGHDTGIYTWNILYDFCKNHARYWNAYLDQIEQSGASREVELAQVKTCTPNSD